MVYVLEVNPRASRTIPFVSKAIGVPLASLAARVMCGETLADIGFTEEIVPPYVSVKEAVFPFNKFRGFDPDPRSGDALDGRGDGDRRFVRHARSPRRSSRRTTGCRSTGAIFITVNDPDKPTVTPIARRFHEMGFTLSRPRARRSICGRAASRRSAVFKVHEGRPNWHRPDRERRGAAADQHAARQARAARRLHAAPGGDRAARRRTRRRCRRRARRATRSSRCGRARRGAVAAGVARRTDRGVADAAATSTRRVRHRATRRRSSTSRPTSTTAPSIGDGTKIWHFCHVMPRRRDRRALQPRPERRRDDGTRSATT